MINKYSLSTALMLTLIAGSTQASVINISDNYIGGSEASGIVYNESDDVIGTAAHFDTTGMNVTISPTGGFQVDIYSRFLNNNGIAGDNIGLGSAIELGDLFISNNGWNPFGSAQYGADVDSNGENWEYVLVLDNHGQKDTNGSDNTNGSLSMYNVDSTRIIHPEDNPSGGYPAAGYRPGQEVQYDTSGLLPSCYTGSWDIWGLSTQDDTDDFLRFSFDAFDIGLRDDNFGFHWAMTCANDVIEGGSDPVPEPATVLLFGVGLTGLIGRNAFRRNKKK